MYIITLILGIIGVVLLAFAIREDEDDRAFPLGILSVVSLICSVMLWCYTDIKHEREQPLTTISTFVEEHSQYLSPTTVRTISATPIREMPDGCFVYSVILVDQDSMYTYSAVLDPENIEVVNFILEESIPRLENHQNKKKINNGKKSSFWLDVR